MSNSPAFSPQEISICAAAASTALIIFSVFLCFVAHLISKESE